MLRIPKRITNRNRNHDRTRNHHRTRNLLPLDENSISGFSGPGEISIPANNGTNNRKHDNVDFASVTTRRLVNAAGSDTILGKVHLALGKGAKLQLSKLEGYHEVPGILEATKDVYADEIIDTTANVLFREILAQPRNSLLLSTGFDFEARMDRVWMNRMNRAWMEYIRVKDIGNRLTGDIETTKQQLVVLESEMNQAMNDYNELKNGYHQRQRELEDLENTSLEQFLKHHQNKMFHRLAGMLRAHPGWQNELIEVIQNILDLHTEADARRLSVADCMDVLHVLKSLKYEKNEYFKNLWSFPPEELSLEDWKGWAGEEAKILVGHQPKAVFQWRICHFLRLEGRTARPPIAPSLENPIDMLDDIGEDNSLEDIDAKKKRLDMDYNNKRKMLELKAEQGELERMMEKNRKKRQRLMENPGAEIMENAGAGAGAGAEKEVPKEDENNDEGGGAQ